MRILYSANGFWSKSGYGVQGAYLVPGLQQLGHDVAMFAWYGLHGGGLQLNGIKVYPGAYHPYGNDIIQAHAQDHKADLVITLIDIWVLDAQAHTNLGAAWLPWFPLDHEPPSPQIVERAKLADYPTTYSRHAYEHLQAAGVEKIHYVGHGVDTEVYQPGDKAAARRALGWPESAFMVSMVAANKGYPSRKAFPEQFQAFARFRETHPEAMLYLHCQPQAPDGIDLPALLAHCGIPPQVVRFANPYKQIMGLPPEYLAQVYQGSDVLLAATMGEGFGIPIVEAQACGCPVVTTDFTAMPELTINGLTTAPAQKYWLQGHLCGWQVVPSAENIADALSQIYYWGAGERAYERDLGIAHIREHYAWPVIIEQGWKPYLERIEVELADRKRQQFVALQDAYAQRDAEMARGEADVWYNAHRFELARAMLAESGVNLEQAAICDLGCAEGHLLKELSGDRIGIDIAPSRIKVAQETDPGMLGLGWYQADAAEWGPADTFDIVVCLELIEHVLDPDALLRNIVRILKPGGVALISTPNAPHGEGVDGQEHRRGYGPETLDAALKAVGLVPFKHRSTLPGLYGPDGLLAHPERLTEWQALAGRRWDYGQGSNLYVLATRPVAVPTDPKRNGHDGSKARRGKVAVVR